MWCIPLSPYNYKIRAYYSSLTLFSISFFELYLTQKRSKKNMNHVTHPLSSASISIFSPEINKFYYFKKYRYRLQLV